MLIIICLKDKQSLYSLFYFYDNLFWFKHGISLKRFAECYCFIKVNIGNSFINFNFFTWW